MSDSRRWDTIRSALRWRSRGRRALLGATTLTIALSAGLCATAFVVLDGVLWKPLPYEDAERLVYIRTIDRLRPTSLNRVSGQELLEWQRHSRTLAASGGFEPPRVGAIEGDDSGALVRIAWVTHDLFSTLGVKPMIGREFEAPATRTTRMRIVISHHLWLRYFGGDRAAIGRTMRFTTLWGGWEVIGVMPPSFDVPRGADAWIPTNVLMRRLDGEYSASHFRLFGVIARLRPGVSLDRAQDELRAISGLLASRDAIGKEGWTPTLTPLRAELVGNYRRVAIMFGAACGLLLVIACAVLVNLVVASVDARRTELAIRLALGASRADLLLLVASDLVLCVVGGCVLAVVFAGWFVPVLSHQFPAGLVEPNGRLPVTMSVLGASLGLGLLTLVAGLAAAWNGGVGRFSRVTSSIRGSSVSAPLRRSVRMLAAQIAPTVALVLVGMVSLRTLGELYDRDYGFDPRGLIVAQLAPPSATAFQGWKAENIVALIERLRHRRGIEGAEVISFAPFDEEMGERWFDAANAPSRTRNGVWTAAESFVTPGYFRLMGIRLEEGRVFDDRPDPKPPSQHEELPRSVIVSRALADRLWPHASAAGRTLGNDPVIGIVEDMSFDGVQRDARPRIYYSFLQRSALNVSILMRAPRAADAVGALRQEVAAVFGDARVSGVTTGEALLAGWLDEQRVVTGLVTALAGLCLALATIGTSYLLWSIVQRGRREVAIRLAIGGRTPHIVRWLYRTIGWPLALGSAVGAVIGALLIRFVNSMFFGLAALDAVSTGISLALLASVALLAGVAPLLAVARMDPIRILQGDS